ncbi:thioredoxin 1 [Paenibacillus sp. PastF-3]|uniref:thioredoxin n=1 Tax=unclassified Paenibacillus TaxID=185978 RepID=UPI000BA16F75|nr:MULTISPECIES: thioredoxin [unclassified Paenibacillus]MDH6374464.1 thioredoxin 1 [Paenibacillus sp. PastF-3]OZQ94748.1 thioredoxin [Paenibacillus sp. VTT E-133291]
MAILHAEDATFAQLIQSKGTTVVNFWAPWCGPCRMFTPVLEEFERESDETITVVKVNVDDNPKTTGNYHVMSIPATLIFKDGQPRQQEVGMLSIHALQQLVASE